MKQFDVYSHSALGLQAVKNGFSWPGCFFTWVWMLICRMWRGGTIVFVVMVVSSVVPALWPISFVVCLVVGIQGNAWRRNRLRERGFEHVRSVQAENGDAALSECGFRPKVIPDSRAK